MNILLRGLALGCLYLISHNLEAVEPSGRVALVVGIDAYPDVPLNNAVSDAKVIRDMLIGSLGFAAADVLYCENPSRLSLLEYFEEFKLASSNAEITLFYYAGHGMEGLNGKDNYLIPVDVEVNQAAQSEAALKANGVNVMVLSDELAESSIGAKIWLLDCCRQRPAGRGSATRAGGGLAQYEDGRMPADTLFMFASGPTRLASDGMQRSPFTEALLEVLPSRELNLSDAIYAVSDRVMAITEKRQEPWVKLDGRGQIFRRQGFLASVSPAPLSNGNDTATTGPRIATPGVGSMEVAPKLNPPASPAPTGMRAEMERAKKSRSLAERVGNAPAINSGVPTVAPGYAAGPSGSSSVTPPIVLNKLSDQTEINSPKELPATQPYVVITEQPKPSVVRLIPQPSRPYPKNTYQRDDYPSDSYDDKARNREAVGRAAAGIARRFLGF